MSIFSTVFLAITTFIANLWGTTKTEWNKLSPEVQANFTKVMTALNIVKGYVLDPSSAPGAFSFLLTAIETAVGPIYMGVINAALNEALIDAGIIGEAFINPLDAWNELINHLHSFGPNSVGDQVGVWASNMIGKIVNDTEVVLNNNQIKAIIAFVYDTLFKVQSTTISSLISVPSPTIGASVLFNRGNSIIGDPATANVAIGSPITLSQSDIAPVQQDEVSTNVAEPIISAPPVEASESI